MTNPTYEPPLTDPREEGVKHWDMLRSELMLSRDALRSSEMDREVMARKIDDLTKDLLRSKAIESEAIRELMAYKTSLEDVGRLVLAVLKRGVEARKNGDPYAPPVIPNAPEALQVHVDAIEGVLSQLAPTFLTRN